MRWHRSLRRHTPISRSCWSMQRAGRILHRRRAAVRTWCSLSSGSTPRSRPVAANAGLDAATGDYIGFLDDDDRLEPGARRRARGGAGSAAGVRGRVCTRAGGRRPRGDGARARRAVFAVHVVPGLSDCDPCGVDPQRVARRFSFRPDVRRLRGLGFLDPGVRGSRIFSPCSQDTVIYRSRASGARDRTRTKPGRIDRRDRTDRRIEAKWQHGRGTHRCWSSKSVTAAARVGVRRKGTAQRADSARRGRAVAVSLPCRRVDVVGNARGAARRIRGRSSAFRARGPRKAR